MNVFPKSFSDVFSCIVFLGLFLCGLFLTRAYAVSFLDSILFVVRGLNQKAVLILENSSGVSLE